MTFAAQIWFAAVPTVVAFSAVIIVLVRQGHREARVAVAQQTAWWSLGAAIVAGTCAVTLSVPAFRGDCESPLYLLGLPGSAAALSCWLAAGRSWQLFTRSVDRADADGVEVELLIITVAVVLTVGAFVLLSVAGEELRGCP